MAKIDYNKWGDERSGQQLTYSMKNMKGIMQHHIKKEIDSVMDEAMDDVGSGVGLNIESLNLNKLITKAIKELVAKQVLEKLSPYYTDEFYSTLRCYGNDVKLKISPWWDDVWQEIKFRDFIKEEIQFYGDTETEDLFKLRNEFIFCISMIENKLKGAIKEIAINDMKKDLQGKINETNKNKQKG